MIISTHALVCVSGRNKPYYESLGYVIPTKPDNKNRKTTKKGTQIYVSDRFSKSRGNGIDRVDSSKGYVLDNCVPCCSTCNFIKNNMPYEEFVSYITKIYQRIVKNEI